MKVNHKAKELIEDDFDFLCYSCEEGGGGKSESNKGLILNLKTVLIKTIVARQLYMRNAFMNTKLALHTSEDPEFLSQSSHVIDMRL